MFSELSGIDPIPHCKKNKNWSTAIKIVLLDGEEKKLETELKYRYSLGYEGMREGTYSAKFDQSRYDSAYSDNYDVFNDESEY